MNFWWRRTLFRWAIALVRRMDGMVVSRAAYDAGLLELGKTTELFADMLIHQPARAKHVEDRLEGIARLLMIAAQAGDPSLQFNELMQRYGQMRTLVMSPRRRQKLLLQEGIRNLPPRVKKSKRAAVCEHARRDARKNGAWTCLDCGTTGVVAAGGAKP